jgi:hypothetical protein
MTITAAAGNVGLAAGTTLTSGSTLTATAGGNMTVNSNLTAGTNLAVTTTGKTSVYNIGNGVTLSAGSLTATAPASGTLAKTDIAKAGSITLKASNGMTIGNNETFTSNGANLTISSTAGNISMGSQLNFTANGGNIQALAKGTLTADSTSASTWNARAVGTSTSSTGGGIEVGSGLSSSSGVVGAFSKKAGTQPSNLAVLGSPTVTAPNNGAIVANITTGTPTPTVNLSQGTASTLDLTNKGAMVFDAVGNGASVTMGNTTFTTTAFKPTGADSLNVVEDEAVVDTGADMEEGFQQSPSMMAEK